MFSLDRVGDTRDAIIRGSEAHDSNHQPGVTLSNCYVQSLDENYNNLFDCCKLTICNKVSAYRRGFRRSCLWIPFLRPCVLGRSAAHLGGRRPRFLGSRLLCGQRLFLERLQQGIQLFVEHFALQCRWDNFIGS